MSNSIESMIQQAIGAPPVRVTPLSGGCVAQVVRVNLADGEQVVAKIDPAGSGVLANEAYMLRYLSERTTLPTPRVRASTPNLLIMDFIEGSTGARGDAEVHAAALLADLHSISDVAFGFERDTVIGGLHQPNPHTASWIEFFRSQRLLHMAQKAVEAGRLPSSIHRRIRPFTERLSEFLIEPAAPSLIHGDVWSGNVLSAGGRVTAFLDPAIYFADAEIELAFITLFSTFGDRFFDSYRERRPIRDGFFDTRRDIYNLYPLLVHVRLFGGHYVDSVDATLRRFSA